MLGAVSYKSEIAAGADFNDYIDTGIYGWNINPGGGQIDNYPNDDTWQAGTLVVYSGPTNTGGYMKSQVIYSYGITKATYTRNRWAGNWSPWVRIYDTSLLTEPSLLSPLASALGVIAETEIKVGGLSSTTVPNASSCSIFVWCVRGASFAIGIAVIENETVSYIRNGFGMVSFSKATRNITLTFENTLSAGCRLRYWLYAFGE